MSDRRTFAPPPGILTPFATALIPCPECAKLIPRSATFAGRLHFPTRLSVRPCPGSWPPSGRGTGE